MWLLRSLEFLSLVAMMAIIYSIDVLSLAKLDDLWHKMEVKVLLYCPKVSSLGVMRLQSFTKEGTPLFGSHSGLENKGGENRGTEIACIATIFFSGGTHLSLSINCSPKPLFWILFLIWATILL